jgi:CRISPR-associated protein Cmr6
MSTYINTGLFFNKHYFKDLNFSGDFKNNDSNIRDLESKNKKIFETVLNNSYPICLGTHQIKLTTIYPGLFLGSGYAHESGVLGELKLGFFFDYATGLPILPGSSVKGILRAAFEKATKQYNPENKKHKASEYIQELLKVIDNKEWLLGEVYNLEQIIFEGEKNSSVYNRDIFFDAHPIGKAIAGKFLANDYITPHDKPLKNPIPLQFLKILPNVQFQFNFKLTDNGLNADIKKELFKQILLDLGIGAKTNVGYGQFELVEEERFKEKKENAERERKAELAELERKNAEKTSSKTEAEKRIVKGAKLKCKVVDITKKEVFFMFDWDAELKFKKMKRRFSIELEINNIIEIEIIDDFYIRQEVLFFNNVTII